jgi:hypothetical protein
MTPAEVRRAMGGIDHTTGQRYETCVLKKGWITAHGEGRGKTLMRGKVSAK